MLEIPLTTDVVRPVIFVNTVSQLQSLQHTLSTDTADRMMQEIHVDALILNLKLLKERDVDIKYVPIMLTEESKEDSVDIYTLVGGIQSALLEIESEILELDEPDEAAVQLIHEAYSHCESLFDTEFELDMEADAEE